MGVVSLARCFYQFDKRVSSPRKARELTSQSVKQDVINLIAVVLDWLIPDQNIFEKAYREFLYHNDVQGILSY